MPFTSSMPGWEKSVQISHARSHSIFQREAGWYNGHDHRGGGKRWIRQIYPIPVIEVKGRINW